MLSVTLLHIRFLWFNTVRMCANALKFNINFGLCVSKHPREMEQYKKIFLILST